MGWLLCSGLFYCLRSAYRVLRMSEPWSPEKPDLGLVHKIQRHVSHSVVLDIVVDWG